MFDRVLIPLAPFVVTTIMAVIALYWLIVVKSDVLRLRARINCDMQRMEEQNQQLRRQIEQLTARLEESENRAGCMPPAPPKSGLNVTKRTQILRLSRRGDDPANIASTLNIPRREIELLLKVHQLSLDRKSESA